MTVLLLATGARAAAEGFSVRASIEMRRFSDPSTRDPSPAPAKYAPDGKSFVVVTTRGLLRSDLMESTIWLFRTAQAAAFLHAVKKTVPPSPQRLADFRARIIHSQNDSYGAVISALKWSSDSRAIYFLGETRSGTRRLYRLALGSGKSPAALTPENQDIESFDARGGTVVYFFKPVRLARATLPGAPINKAATDITGVYITTTLFPAGIGAQLVPAHLGIIRGTTARVLKDPQTGLPVEFGATSRKAIPAVSPDGRSAILLTPARSFPASWGSYHVSRPSLKLQPRPATAASQLGELWPAQYTLLDTTRATFEPLVNAPNAWIAGRANMSIAAWSPDGNSVLVSNTFLPLEDKNGGVMPNAEDACVLAVIDLPRRDTQCLSRSIVTEGSAERFVLIGASFDGAKILATSRYYDVVRTDIYQKRAGDWLPAQSESDTPDAALNPIAAVKQDLNDPPALWIEDQNKTARKLWDPAPEVSAAPMGLASAYRWRDKAGAENVGILVLPPGYNHGTRYPLVIQTHGAHNEREFVTDGAFTTAFAARELAAVGFVVLEVRDRHELPDNEKEASVMVDAFDSAIEKLSREGLIDPDRVGIIGFSRTCWYVESAIIRSSPRYAAASLSDGVDQSYMSHMLFDVDRDLEDLSHIYGSKPFGDGMRNWLDKAPDFQLHRLQTPVMVTAISAASVLGEWEIYSSLRQQHKPVDFVYIPGGQHVLQNPLERLASQGSNVDWFRFWLQGFEDQTPEKAEQYRRWEGLCDMQIAEKTGKPTFCVSTKH